MIHRDRCLEIPSAPHRADYWVGGWEEYPDKDTALEALENTDAASQLRNALFVSRKTFSGICFFRQATLLHPRSQH